VGRGEAGDARVDERRLLKQVQAGAPSAHSEFVRLHQHAIFGLVVRMVRDHAVAEELTQDAFVKAFRSIGSFRGDAKLSTWLYRIAVNLCHDYHASVTARMRREETSFTTEGGNLELPAREPSPDDAAVTREMAADFQRGLDGLSEPYRTAFILRHQEDLGYDELAQVLEISRSNAKVRVHRAREMLIAVLRDQGHDV
jgi:RNA polymerase sigma-70 factor (ECF subfamily)